MCDPRPVRRLLQMGAGHDALCAHLEEPTSIVLQIFEIYVPSAQETGCYSMHTRGRLPYELLDFCQCICGFGAMPIGMLARAIVTELNGNRHVRGSSLFARVDLRHALHHASREVHGGGAPNALQ